ncbi:MAG: hypothetical protein ABI868_18555 [Acidobacteriota bacterium]
MLFKSSVRPIAVALSISAATPLAAQSLGEVARREEARRKEIRQPARVYTNKDLTHVPPPVPAAAPAAGETPATPLPADTTAAGERAPDAAEPGAARDQKYWSKRMRDLVVQLDRDQIYVGALQSRINVLTTDFALRDDPAQRAVITRERERAIDELDRLQLVIDRTTTAIADLEEEARRASVPPGWLR